MAQHEDDEPPLSPPTPPEPQTHGSVEEKVAAGIHHKDKHIFKVQCFEETHYGHVHKRIEGLLCSVQSSAAARRQSSEHTSRHLADVKEAAEEGLRQERYARSALETKLTGQIEECFADCVTLKQEKISRHEAFQKVSGQLSDEIGRLYRDIGMLQKFRVEKAQELFEGVRAKLDEIRDATSAEKRYREESESTLLEMFGQMGQKCQLELDATRRDRIQACNRIMDVMESVLPQMAEAVASGEKIAMGGNPLEDTGGDTKVMVQKASQNMKDGKGKTLNRGKSLLLKSSQVEG